METKSRAEKDKRYEEKHKEERKAKNATWGTSIPREKAEQINAFLKQNRYTKVQLIEAGYRALSDKVARREHDDAAFMAKCEELIGTLEELCRDTSK